MPRGEDDGDREAQRRARLAHAERLLHDRKYRQQWEQQKRLAAVPQVEEDTGFEIRQRRAAPATGSGKCIAEQRFYQRVPGYALRVRSYALD
jgi:hypothetical protein